MSLKQALGFPTVVDTMICDPETPSLKDLLTQLLAVLSVDGLHLQAVQGLPQLQRAASSKVMPLFLGDPQPVTD